MHTIYTILIFTYMPILKDKYTLQYMCLCCLRHVYIYIYTYICSIYAYFNMLEDTWSTGGGCCLKYPTEVRPDGRSAFMKLPERLPGGPQTILAIVEIHENSSLKKVNSLQVGILSLPSLPQDADGGWFHIFPWSSILRKTFSMWIITFGMGGTTVDQQHPVTL